jgi:hypothetical protein
MPMTPNDSTIGREPEKHEFDVIGDKDFYAGNKNKKMIVHFMINPNKEVGKPKKIRVYAQEVTWKKRTWPINRNNIVTDSKGMSHYYVDINKERSYSFKATITDTCKKCGGDLAIDSRNVRDLVKRKTIETFWGVDSTHIMLLLIMGIVLVAMIGVIFYMYTDNSKLNIQHIKDLATITQLQNPKVTSQ